MAPLITASTLENSGIELRACDDPNFDGLVHSLFLGDVGALLRLKPFLLIVANHSNQNLVAYTTSWKAGRKITLCQAKYPDALAPETPKRDNEIRPGEQRITAMSVELHDGSWAIPTEIFYLEQFERHYARYSNIAELSISLDAAIFADGTLLGPDHSNLAEHLAEFVRAKQALYRRIAENPEQTFRSIDKALESERTVEPGLPRSLYTRLAIEDAGRWRRLYPERDVRELFAGAIRREPFKIKRP